MKYFIYGYYDEPSELATIEKYKDVLYKGTDPMFQYFTLVFDSHQMDEAAFFRLQFTGEIIEAKEISDLAYDDWVHVVENPQPNISEKKETLASVYCRWTIKKLSRTLKGKMPKVYLPKR